MSFAPDPDSYFTLSGKSEGIHKDRGSKFLYFAFPVENEEGIKSELTALRKQYFDATHQCYAWVLDQNGGRYRANDDGEPNHSAGDPILGQIRSHRLTQVLIVVIRYFGGTKLGVSGLIQAYKTAAAMAIESNEIIKKWVMDTIHIRFPYPSMNEVMKLVKSESLEITHQELGLDCKLSLEMRKGQVSRVYEILQEIEGLRFNTD